MNYSGYIDISAILTYKLKKERDVFLCKFNKKVHAFCREELS